VGEAQADAHRGALRAVSEESRLPFLEEPDARRAAEAADTGHERSGAVLLRRRYHDPVDRCSHPGGLCLHRKRINISTVLAGQRLGIKEVDDGIWLVSFMHYDLGYFDLEQKTLQPLDNPFGTRLSPMS
jgi:hypothetical protein